MASHFLPESVYVCFTCDGTVFLDLARDEYFGLDAAQTELFRALLVQNGQPNPDADALACDLVARGFLTREAQGSRPIEPISISTPDTLVLNPENDARPRVSFVHWYHLALACLATWFALHRRSLRHAVVRLRAAQGRVKQRQAVDTARVEELVRVFLYLRPVFYGARENCLYNSFVLADFLRRFKVPATCVFGVKTLPFEAHCWVQSGRFLLHDETPESISIFSPILAI